MTLLVVALLAGCGGERSGPGLTVLAASSLTEAFTELAADFEDAHPQTSVTLSFAGSQTLATQVRHGLRADVLASANPMQVHTLVEEGLASDARTFAHNRLVLVVSSRFIQPVDLLGLQEVERLVLGAPDVPIGQYTQALLDAAEHRYGSAWRQRVEDRVVSRELSVRMVAAKVALGEADAGVVYATDGMGLEEVQAIPLPEDLAPQANYQHVLLADAPAPERAEQWRAWVESPAGRATLQHRGFETP